MIFPPATANTIFIKSPIKNGITHCANAEINDVFIKFINHIVPNKYVTESPTIIPNPCKTTFFSKRLTNKPLIKAIKMNPIKYPPVGPANTCAPPENPENTGNPMKPNNKYTQHEIVDLIAPKRYAVNGVG